MRTPILLAALVLLSTSALARTVAGVAVPESVVVDGQTLKLNGSVLREATILGIDVYVISLYRLEKTRSAKAVLDCAQPLHLTKRFVRDVDLDDLAPPWREATQKRARKLGVKAQGAIDSLIRGLRDMKDGQTIGLTWVPGKSLDVTVEGRRTAHITGVGADFCKVVYAGYVGGMANDADVAKGLLGR